MTIASPMSSDIPWFYVTSDRQPELPPDCPPDIRPHVEFFLANGYVVLKKSVQPTVCDEVLQAFRSFERANHEKFSKQLDKDGHYPRIINLHTACRDLIRLFAENTLALRLQDYLFQAETVLYTSLFYERGSAQSLHRDTPYFCTRPEYRYFGMWVPMEDVDADNGPLAVVPGGHRLPEFNRPAMALRHYASLDDIPASSDALWIDYQNAVGEACAASGLPTTEVHVQKGDTIIWHPQLPHAGSPIRDLRRTRFSLVMHTTPMGVPVYHNHVFFNPEKPFPTTAAWRYDEFEGRRYAAHDSISFGHVVDYKVNELTLNRGLWENVVNRGKRLIRGK